MNKTFIALITVLVVTSCTIEKRAYNKGFNIQRSANFKRTSEHEHQDTISKRSEKNSKGQINESVTNVLETPLIAEQSVQTNGTLPTSIERNEIQPKQQSLFVQELKQATHEAKQYFFPINKKEDAEEPVKKKVDFYSLLGFITGVLGIALFGFLLGVIAVLYGILGIRRINRQPEKLRGKGLAIAAIVLGVVDILVWIVLLALLL